MKAFRFSTVFTALALFGCGGPVPSGVFLTMSVSTRDVAVVTSINGKADEFLSGDSGSMTGSRPINKLVNEGENEAIFVVSPIETNDGQSLEPELLAALEISVKGEVVDTLQPGARNIFSRELTDAEAASIIDGKTVTIIEHFTVDKAALLAIKNGD